MRGGRREPRASALCHFRTLSRRSETLVVRPYASSESIPSTAAASAPALDARTCIIVAGMHRSGTSATARVINLLGADIASDLLPSIPGNNDRGFWESATTY